LPESLAFATQQALEQITHPLSTFDSCDHLIELALGK
jgi:hypothetical protein